MILVDTSIWIYHLRTGQGRLSERLEQGLVLGHPWVLGELALGNLARRDEILGLLAALPQAAVATDREVVDLVDRRGLSGSGIGYVDAQLLAATLLTPDAGLWTADLRLRAAAARLGCGWEET